MRGMNFSECKEFVDFDWTSGCKHGAGVKVSSPPLHFSLFIRLFRQRPTAGIKM